jgi:ATP-dependent Clp protease, protease subunit
VSLRQLPEAKTFQRPQNYQWDAPADVLARWADSPMAAADGESDTITIFDVIGEDWWTGGGFTAKRMSAALRSVGNKDVVVQINSPGGDLFEGIAIYNLLRGHSAKVTVEVMGMAASAASIIAMAADDLAMGRGSFMMVHNAWGVVLGNRHDMAQAADLFTSFDAAIADIYVARTGRKLADVQKLMDAETFMDPQKAIAEKFADRIDDEIGANASIEKPADPEERRRLMARRQTEGALAKAGIPRAHRGAIINDLATAARDAGRGNAPRDAGDVLAGLRQLTQTLRS